MPKLRQYTVTQDREIKVSATHILEAAALATRAFDGKETVEDEKNIRGEILIRDISVREDY